MRDAAGNLVLRDRGAIRDTILFDTAGDDQPGGELLEVLDSSVHGTFPGLTDAFCAHWAE